MTRLKKRLLLGGTIILLLLVALVALFYRPTRLALARDLTVYASSNDRALLASRFVNRERRLGTSPPNILNPDQIQAAA